MAKEKKKSPEEASNTFHNIMKASVKPSNMENKCPTCGKKAHDFEKEEAMNCVPPKEVLKFGKYQFDKKYRNALYKEFPMYTTEEVVGSYLGHNPHFPSQNAWLDEND